jgi:hypothetical protein
MATAWQTVEEAALTLGISSRTLHRRMSRSEFETRLENGRREVLVVIPEMEPIVPPHWQNMGSRAADARNDVTDTSDAPDAAPDGVSDEVQESMLALHEDRLRRTDLAIMAYQQSVTVTAADARRAHRATRVAWSVAGGIIVSTFLAATWATHTVTRAHAEAEQLSGAVRQLSATAETKTREAEDLRTRAEDARVAAARIEGELTAAKNRIDQLVADRAVEARFLTGPTTAPSASAPGAQSTQPAVAAVPTVRTLTPPVPPVQQ